MKGFIKGEASRLLRTNSSQPIFEENIRNLPYTLRIEVIQQQQWRNISQKSNVLKEKRRCQIRTEPRKRKFYPLSHNTTRRCQT